MKAETEKKLWFSLFLVVYLGIATLLLGDAVAVQQAHPEHSILVGTLMIISGILVAVYIYEDGEIPVLENRKYAKYCNLVGPVLLFLVVLSLDVRQPAGDCIYWALFFAPLGSFSLVMMLRPVSTDMGSFYPLCALSFTISLRDYHYSWRTWVAMAVSIFLMFTRAHMETRAIFAIAARKKALRDAVETSTADVADA